MSNRSNHWSKVVPEREMTRDERGLGLLKLFTHRLTRVDPISNPPVISTVATYWPSWRARSGTLLFFYGIIVCVGGLGHIGCLTLASEMMHAGPVRPPRTSTSGSCRAVIDNIPLMFAVLTVNPRWTPAGGSWLPPDQCAVFVTGG